MTNPIFLSVVIPAYNESKRIGATLQSLEEFFSKTPYSHEVIVVNDGSKDNTAAVVEMYIERLPRLNLRLIDNARNKGKGYAVKCGMQEASGAYRLFMDADNSTKIGEIDGFIREMEKSGHDVAIGSIAFTYSNTVEHNGWHRRFLGSISKMLVRIIAVPGIYDTQRGFKVFTARAARAIFPRQITDRFGFDIELLLIARLYGFSMIELPVEWDNPPGSTVKLKAYIETFTELFHIFANKVRGRYDPSYGPALEESGYFARLFRELTYIPRRVWREATDSPMHLHIRLIERGKGLIFKGKEFKHHTKLHHSETALYSLVRAQKVFIAAAVIILTAAFAVNWHATVVVLISVITILYFLDLLFNMYLTLRSIDKNPEIAVSRREVDSLSDEELPRYTIFCPLYKEWQVIPQFIEAMSRLDYPSEKLEVIFLLEENDKETIRVAEETELPDHFKIVVVPHAMPKTKPKAMNYGLDHVTGDYLVIYDAEDVPEPDQLKKAVLAFRKSHDKIICVQAKLNFYNVKQNVLTKMFTAEYSLWFDLILPGLQSLEAPIPLGGTSNHFKVSVLREINGWDAFNVTEDCDLGMRLAKRGYRTAIVDSTTYEEANSDALNWYNQRSRWIKGYIQTYLVHMRRLDNFKGRLRDFLAFQIIVGGKIFSMVVNPLFWAITISYFVFRESLGPFIESFFPQAILYLGVLSLIFGNFLYLYNYMIGCIKRRFDYLTKYIFLVPIYWLGMSVAAWRAVYEIVVKPHYWSKTRHGLHLKTAATNP